MSGGVSQYVTGSKVAFQWYASGCRTLQDIKVRKGGIVVTPVQELGLRFYDGEFISKSSHIVISHCTQISTTGCPAVKQNKFSI